MFDHKKAVFFDLDNTLLPLDEKQFFALYFGELGRFFLPFGIHPDILVKTILYGTEAMRKNDGTKTNEIVFWDACRLFQKDLVPVMKQHIQAFYKDRFPLVKEAAKPLSFPQSWMHILKKKRLRLFLTTNPLFPSMATHQRVEWAGLSVTDFDIITTMENASFCKPNPLYFQSVLNQFNLHANDVIMIGNDWIEDTCAELVGIDTVILEDYASQKRPIYSKAKNITINNLNSIIESL
jgi:FMN phosphatase YigB (HAD superfamily)